MNKPTDEAYGELQAAYDYYNQQLFSGQLPDCLLTVQRKNPRTLGYFSPNRFAQQGGVQIDELAMNPAYFHTQEVVGVLSTLVHEMVHVWQQHFGKASRRGYHNKEWGSKMKEVGLYPSNTGAQGGKETGQQMMHFIISGGAFERATKKLTARGFGITWAEAEGIKLPSPGEPGDGDDKPKPEPIPKGNRFKYRCPGCGLNAWGKPHIVLMCGKCKETMEAV